MQLLIAADLHLRGDRPRCRLDDDWYVAQAHALKQLKNYVNSIGAPLCIIGDIFHTASVPPWVVVLFMNYLNKMKQPVYALPGNHDLPYHSYESVENSAYGILKESGKIRPLEEIGRAAPYGEEPKGNKDSGLLFLHTLVFPTSEEIPPNSKARTARELLSDYPDAQWIFTGDMHHAFHYEHKGRHVVNPGCLMRQTADMKDYQPNVAFVDTELASVTWHPIIDRGELVTDSYLKAESERKERIESFVEKVQASGPVSLDFRHNLLQALEGADIPPEVKKMTLELLRKAEGEEK